MKKTIALLPFKNEELFLPSYLKNVLPVVDEIIAIDDGSTDNGRTILEQHPNIKIYDNKELLKSGWAEFNIRQKLLEFGREADGKIFVCLDADEALSTNFVPIARKVFEKLEPGQKLSLQWLALWKTTTHYRDDKSVWSNNFKDFVVCDDGKSTHDYAFLGVGRTPGQNTDTNWLKLNPKHGTVLHYQFSLWNKFQIKQAWYRCSELIQTPGQHSSINQKYSITLEDNNVLLREIPEEWYKNIPINDINLGAMDNSFTVDNNWHLKTIKQWFQEYTSNYFKDLDIWHIKEIKNLL